VSWWCFGGALEDIRVEEPINQKLNGQPLFTFFKILNKFFETRRSTRILERNRAGMSPIRGGGFILGDASLPHQGCAQ
jgi:hypothetical protein